MAGPDAQTLAAHQVTRLRPVAASIARLPPHMNPVTNPAARRAMPPHMQPHLSAIAAHPELSAIATGAIPAAGAGAAPMTSPTGGASIAGAYDSLAPNQTSFRRLPEVRHQICGAAPFVAAAAGSGSLIFTPQVPFKGNRLVIPSATLAGTTITNMLVGTKPQYVSQSTEAFDLFEEQSTAGIWDIDLCEVGQKIQCGVTVTGATTVFACWIGEAHDGKPYPMLRSGLKRAAFVTAATVAAAATTTITIAPQVRFKPRKLVLDDATAKFFSIVSFNIGITPQFISGDPVPAGAFTELAQDLWLDCDEAYIGNVISLTVTNFDAAAHLFAGAFLGDVDPRDLAGASGYYQ